MVVWWLSVLIYAGLTVVGELLRPRPKYKDAAATPLGEFQSPTAVENRSVPIVFGTCHIKGPNVLWYGDYAASPIKEEVPSGFLGLGDKKVITGYEYLLGFMYGLCAGRIDDLVEMRYDDKPLPGGTVRVVTGHRDIEFKKADFAAGAWQIASLPIGVFTSFEALAVAAEAAMDGVIPADWKVAYGFSVVQGRTDAIVYSVTYNGVSTKYVVTLAPGIYTTGVDLATEIARTLNEKETELAAGGAPRVTFSAQYDSRTGKFKIGAIATDATKATAFSLYANITAEFSIATTALVTIGFDISTSNVTSAALSTFPVVYLTGAWEVRQNRFTFACREDNATLRTSSTLFTARSLFGFTYAPGALDKALGHAIAEYEVLDTGTSYSQVGADVIRVDVNCPNLFGGYRAEGGIVGTYEVYRGTPTQTANAYLASKMPLQGGAPTVPAFRGLCYAVAARPYIGTNLYIKPVSFVVRRCPNTLGLTGGDDNIGGDANPAAMVYDILTNTDWGLGISPTVIDTTSFIAVGDTLATEGLGLSIQFDTAGAAWSWVEEVLRHVDGVLYEDTITGKLGLKIARADYTVGALPLVDDSVASLIKFSRPSWDELRTSVRISYIDRAADFMERTVKATDLGAVEVGGGIETVEDIPFHGISNAAMAQKAAARALKALAHPMARCELASNRKSWALKPGDVFRWTWPALGITDLPLRVLRIRGGTLEDGSIKIEAAEDIFGVPWTAYSAPTAPVWTDPAILPPQLIAARAEEVPYALLDAESNRILTLGVPDPTSDAITMGYEVHTDPDGYDAFRLTEKCMNPTPSGTLVAGIDEVVTVLDVNDGFDLASIRSHLTDQEMAEGRLLLLIDSEAIAFQHFTLNSDGTWRVDNAVRGVWDTAPASHSIGARVWIVSGGMGTARPEEYPAGATVTLKLVPFNRRGTAPITEAVELAVTANQRSLRPISPKGLTVNTLVYPINVNGDLAFAWKHRDRLADWSYANAGETAAIEAGCTYTVRIYNENGTLQKTATGITGLSYAYTVASEAADNPLGRANGVVTVAVVAKRTSDGMESPSALTDTFDCAGWGMLWGEYYGGAAG